MKSHSLKELILEGVYKYNKKISPADNYRLFQQAISFERGVEFLSSSNDQPGPIIYLIKVPGLSTDLKQTKALLERFNKELLDHFAFNIQNQKDLSKVNEIYFDLYDAVINQQQEYHLGKEKYFGLATVREFPHKDIKELKLPIIRSDYRGTFLNSMKVTTVPVEYKKLGPEVKKFLSSLYMVKRRYNGQLLDELQKFKQVFFNKKDVIGHYHYAGDLTDIIEIAMALIESGKLHSLKDTDIDLNEFCSDLCKFLGLSFTKLSNHLPTIEKRSLHGKLFLNEAKKLLKSSSVLLNRS